MGSRNLGEGGRCCTLEPLFFKIWGRNSWNYPYANPRYKGQKRLWGQVGLEIEQG